MAAEKQDLPAQVGQKNRSKNGRGGQRGSTADFGFCMSVEGELVELSLEMVMDHLGAAGSESRARQLCRGGHSPNLAVKEGDETFFGQWEEAPREGDFIHAYEYLMGGCRDRASFSVISSERGDGHRLKFRKCHLKKPFLKRGF